MINTIYIQSKDQVESALNTNGVLLLNEFLKNSNETILELQKLKYDEIFEADERHYFKANTLLFEDVLNYLGSITHSEINHYEVFKFVKGGFTLQNYDSDYEGFEAYLIFTKNWSEEFRGELTYVFEEPLIMNINNNSLFICLKPLEVNRFFKRINYKAKDEEFFAVRFFKK